MFKPDVPLIIMRHRVLTYLQKSFLLWCWISRDSDERCDLISEVQDCNLRSRNVTWYANFFGIQRTTFHEHVFTALRKHNIIKTRTVSGCEVTYVDFTMFN